MAKKRKQKWYERQIERRITRYETMSDDEFYSTYRREMVWSVASSSVGVLIVIGCVVVVALFI